MDRGHRWWGEEGGSLTDRLEYHVAQHALSLRHKRSGGFEDRDVV